MIDTEERVRGYTCDAVSDCLPDQITAVSRFEAGDRHAVYKVSYLTPTGTTSDVVVRISIGDDADECAQATREARVLERVQDIAAPLLYDFRCESRWFNTATMCMQFARGEQRALSTREDIEGLATIIGRVHRVTAEDFADWTAPNTIASYFDDRATDIIGKQQTLRYPLPASVQQRVTRALSRVNATVADARSSDSFGTGEGLALLHGDPGIGNIIWTPKPVLIDWEYARLGEPADEIAYIFGQHGLTATQRAAFWHAYRRTTDPQLPLEHVVDRVHAWEPLTLLGSALWWLERWSRRADADAAGEVDRSAPRQQDYYIDNAIRRLDRFDVSFTRSRA